MQNYKTINFFYEYLECFMNLKIPVVLFFDTDKAMFSQQQWDRLYDVIQDSRSPYVYFFSNIKPGFISNNGIENLNTKEMFMFIFLNFDPKKSTHQDILFEIKSKTIYIMVVSPYKLLNFQYGINFLVNAQYNFNDDLNFYTFLKIYNILVINSLKRERTIKKKLTQKESIARARKRRSIIAKKKKQKKSDELYLKEFEKRIIDANNDKNKKK